MQAIDRNQTFHKDRATLAGKEIETTLLGLGPAKTCDELTEQANQTASTLLAKHKSATEEHDQKTEYGRKDGVSLI
jgi:predicted secreted Zn-dependent protease